MHLGRRWDLDRRTDCTMFTKENSQLFCNSRSLTLHRIVLPLQKNVHSHNFVSHVSQKLRYDQTWEKPTVHVSSVMLLVFPREHNSNCFLQSAMQSTHLKAKLRILSRNLKKIKVSCLYQMLPCENISYIFANYYTLNIANNANYIIEYVYIFTKTVLHISVRTAPSSVRTSYYFLKLSGFLRLHWLCHRP